ncbi:MAG: class I SAM-dependent methyltransferase, partial [Jiangellaceae bacterium]
CRLVAIFDPRLAPLYDALDGPREDLDHYVDIVRELLAYRVLDVGGGTGCLALRLAKQGVEVTVVDPARASLEVAQAKPGAKLVRWIHGAAADLTPLSADLAVMTGNVAQVFLEDDAWADVLLDERRLLKPGGHLVLETRRPECRAWEQWQTEPVQVRVTTPA